MHLLDNQVLVLSVITGDENKFWINIFVKMLKRWIGFIICIELYYLIILT